MPEITELLCKVPWLAKVGRGELSTTRGLWTATRLPPGEPLWHQGARSSEIAILVEGELGVFVDGGRVGTVHQGELMGEAAAWFQQIDRTATVKAKFFAKVVSLPVSGLKELRRDRSPVYATLLDQALVTLSRRIRAVDLDIAKAGAGAVQRPKREAGLVQSLWRKLVPGKPKGTCPPLVPLLKKQPGLKLLKDHQLEEIAAGWEPVALQEGEVVFLEGEKGDSAYLVAEGEVEVIRNVRGDKAQRLAVLLAGDTFGINTLIEPGTRSASCVAGGPTWVYRISRKAFRSPRGDSGTLWKESILASLASQIRAANLALNRAKRVPPPPGGRRADSPEAFRQLLLAHGLIEGLPVSEHSVDLAL